jgi:hypothetical protein
MPSSSLARGVGMAGKQFGQNFDRQQEEKYSDMARQGYTKATGSVSGSKSHLLCSLLIWNATPTGHSHQGSELKDVRICMTSLFYNHG